ncbi:glycerol kinase GlpK [Pseudochrobactrum sp. HB0163]|uniref:glycerol kinase GlpK n=1 Tax=Pseudochrobactrum sp. HB0163 TaxID=3450708 RepID=UPI003F6E3F5E
MSKLILAIDQGTTSSRAICFDEKHKIVGLGQQEFTQYYPKSGWVEHDPEEIWQSVIATCKQAVVQAEAAMADVAAIGITNQRETVVVWDKITGKPVYNAIVWQDRRTQKECLKLKKQGLEPRIRRKTGLLLDPYFSGTKLAWILNKVSGARKKAAKGDLLFGTIDSFLIWRLTGGKVHATDATNASRTLLFNIEQNDWDDELLNLFGIPRAMLPEVKDCADDFGVSDAAILGAQIPILGVAGDQHAAMIGQACFEKGMLKATFGTGCFALLNTGKDKVLSRNRLLTTIAYRLNGEVTYALEGSIFVAGAAVQWLRDGLKIIKNAAESGELALQADEAQDVYLVPAFVGLGAPYWDAEARGAIYGLTRNSGPAEIAKAALESVAFQAHDLLEAMHKDWKTDENDVVLRVDGGMVASDWTMQNLADILNAPVDRPVILETTALGAAWLAGMKAGLWGNMQAFSQGWEQQQRFEPLMDSALRKRKMNGWRKSVRSTLRVK